MRKRNALDLLSHQHPKYKELKAQNQPVPHERKPRGDSFNEKLIDKIPDDRLIGLIDKLAARNPTIVKELLERRAGKQDTDQSVAVNVIIYRVDNTNSELPVIISKQEPAHLVENQAIQDKETPSTPQIPAGDDSIH